VRGIRVDFQRAGSKLTFVLFIQLCGIEEDRQNCWLYQ
jgi:hypothetical protein